MKQKQKQEVKALHAAAAADSWHNETETREMKRKNKCCSSEKRLVVVVVGCGVWGVEVCRQCGKLSVTKAFTFDAFFVAFGLELFSVFVIFFRFDHLTFCWFLKFNKASIELRLQL